jgi:hypothetical protein
MGILTKRRAINLPNPEVMKYPPSRAGLSAARRKEGFITNGNTIKLFFS